MADFRRFPDHADYSGTDERNRQGSGVPPFPTKREGGYLRPRLFRQPMGISRQSGFLSDSLYLLFSDFLCLMDLLRTHRTDSDEFPADAGQLDYHCGVNGHAGY